MTVSEHNKVTFGIRDIRELEFFVDESKDANRKVDLKFDVGISTDIKSDLIGITITGSYLHAETKDTVLKGKVVTLFSVKDMSSFRGPLKNDQETVNLPDDVWVTLFSIAFTHCRAIFARSAAGTKFSHFILPVINPRVEFEKLFGTLAQK